MYCLINTVADKERRLTPPKSGCKEVTMDRPPQRTGLRILLWNHFFLLSPRNRKASHGLFGLISLLIFVIVLPLGPRTVALAKRCPEQVRILCGRRLRHASAPQAVALGLRDSAGSRAQLSFSTHTPTHSESCLVRFPRILAFPAVL